MEHNIDTTHEDLLWRHGSTLRDGQSLVGYDVEARDGSIGKIDEHTDTAGRHTIVVDTGFWIFGKKRRIPAGVIEQIDHEEEKVWVSMTKEEIKAAPEDRNDDVDSQRSPVVTGTDDQFDVAMYAKYYAPFLG